MSLFKKLLGTATVSNTKTCGELYEELGEVIDGTIKDCMRIADVDLLEGALGLDEQTGALVGCAMDGYQKIMRISAQMAAISDRQEAKIDEISKQLDAVNKDLAKANEMLFKLCKSMS